MIVIVIVHQHQVIFVVIGVAIVGLLVLHGWRDVVHINDRVVGRSAMLSPDGAGVVEAFQSCMPRLHIGKPTQPDKVIRMVAIAKLTDNLCAISLLLFDEMLIKQGDEIVAQTRLVDILTQFYDGTTPLYGLLWRLSRACAGSHLRLGTCI